MAKTPVPTVAVPAVAVVDVGGFKFDTGIQMPAVTRNTDRATSDLVRKLLAMPVGASFCEAVVLPEGVLEAERGNVFKEKARRLSNQLSGTVRRLRKTEAGANRVYELRTVHDDTLGHGVRIWRNADSPVSDAPDAPAGDAAS